MFCTISGQGKKGFNLTFNCWTTLCNLESAVEKCKKWPSWQYFKEVVHIFTHAWRLQNQNFPLMSCSPVSFLPLRAKYKFWAFHSSFRLRSESVACQQLMSTRTNPPESASYELAAEATGLVLIWPCMCACKYKYMCYRHKQHSGASMSSSVDCK